MIVTSQAPFARPSPGRLVDAVLHPATNSDQTICEAAGGAATQILSRIREMVCE